MNAAGPADPPARRRRAPGGRAAAVAVAMLFPSLATWLYFVALAGRPSMQVVYAACKTLQFAFPLAWVLGFERGRLDLARRAGGLRHGSGLGASLGPGLVFGLLVAAAMLGAYFGFLETSPLLASAPAAVLAKVRQIGAETPLRFLALALFYSLAHSFLEEYYWRWFVFGGLRSLMPVRLAIVVSGLGFMAHHVIIVAAYFGGAWWMIVLFSVCVAAGGSVWAWIYHRSGSLYGPWLSHLLVDAAIMTIGYDMMSRALS